MSDENKSRGQGMTKSYLNFIDSNVLFRKPISCLLAVFSLLIPLDFLFQIIQYDIFSSDNGRLIAAAILILAVLIFSGVFGFLIWWHRRINRDDGPKIYANFRRFVQTLGEWTGTMFALMVFGSVIFLMLLLKNEYYRISGLLPFSVPYINFNTALLGPVIGFLIIICTRIFLFLLDPFIRLVKKIWILIVRIVLYSYRCIVKFFGIVEQNSSVWIGVVWLFSAAVVITGISLCCYLFRYPRIVFFICGVITLALGLAMMAFLVIKRKNNDA